MEQSQAQTVAQAVQAATQQQQQQHQVAQTSPPVQAPQPTQSSTIDNLTCQWQGCGERCDTAEALYDHVCERHVGRKSTNNLNLTCQWGACRTTTVKRDHITSHIRVHVPLKPHKCDFCGKAFKRPQDLKKHVKTHADDSVLMNSPNPNQNARGSLQNAGLSQQNGKRKYHDSLARPIDTDWHAAAGYYPAGQDGHMNNPYPTYQPGLGQNTGAQYPPGQNGQYAGYGSVNYPNSSAMADLQSMDTRRRAIEALNDFLGDIKRRSINPTEYYDVGQRLQGNSLPLPVPNGNGYNTGYNNIGSGYSNMSAASLLESFNHANMGGNGGGMGGPMVQQGYSLPLPNARTKTDLQDIDRFLEQLQHTVYETSTQASAAGIQQPGVHSHFTDDDPFGNSMRSSNSPTNFAQLNSGGHSGGAMSSSIGSNNVAAFDDRTPALTPAASVSSYSSAYSPMSSHSRSSLGSMSGSAVYPSLPSVTGLSDLGNGYPSTTSAPASGLASGFEGLGDSRRYSGGRLQRQAPAQQDTEMLDAEDGSRTPRASDSQRPKSKGNSSIDPALRGEDERCPAESASTPAAQSEGTEDKKQEDWVENMRIIEALRKWVGERIKNHEFEENTSSEPQGEDAKMVETAKMAEKMADVAADNARTDAANRAAGDVKYPTLPQAA
ncbi:hypothetical protein K431DRAFT_323139 [Polychaeton citri CBS 116435]|uniref:C2H2-type domain-containing protein n=1 Tax=Polychaeton citri CBS 116435 TaxID=1314669 RepID=A0A9P4ULM9_9PEZI|nr:hypothetical protein K431DRAFT_323139 [Polychaeton citri CBS 116435]